MHTCDAGIEVGCYLANSYWEFRSAAMLNKLLLTLSIPIIWHVFGPRKIVFNIYMILYGLSALRVAPVLLFSRWSNVP